MGRRIWSALAIAAGVAGSLLVWAWLDGRTATTGGVAPKAALATRGPSGEGSAELERSEEPRTAIPAAEDAAGEVPGIPAERALPAGGLVVEVVDAQALPVPGVSVEFVYRMPGGKGERLAVATARAPDGLAHFDLAPITAFRERLRGHSLAVEPGLRADFASAEPVRVALAAWPLDGDRVRLELPSAGALHVRLLDAAGNALDAGQVAWFWLPADVAAAQPDAGYERIGQHLVDTRGGLARIEPVGLGLTFQLSVSSPGLGAVAPRGIEGPRSPGEVRVVDVRLGPPVATLRLRVLDPRGAPLADARLWAELWADPEWVPPPAAGPPRAHSFSLSTDAEGWAAVPRAPGSAPVAPRLDLSLRSRGSLAQDDPDWSTASVLLPTTLGEGEVVVLGDVQLAPVPVLLAGTVVDVAGEPVPQVQLNFRERHGEGREHRWYNLADGGVRADANGHFRVRGVRLPRALGLTARAQGFEVLELDDLPIGALDQRVVLQPSGAPPPSGTLRVEVVLDEGIPFLGLLLRLRARAGRSRTPDWYPGRVLAFDGLTPGTYDVWMETRDGGFELGRVEGVEVVAGRATSDPRLLPLDLRGAARLVRFQFVRPDGTPWRRTEFVLGSVAGDADVNLRTDDEGLAACILPRSLARVRIAGSAREPLQVDLGTADGPLRVEFAPE